MSATYNETDISRRDFLYITTGVVGATGTALALWPFVDQMNPDASVLALASTEFDLAPLAEGQGVTIKWRGKPVFIRRRTKEEIEGAKKVPMSELKDPLARNANLPADAKATDENRLKDANGKFNEQYLVQIGICTHLGCVPLGEQGEYHGWFCPCHGSVYDTAGRIRKGPAPRNLDIPPFKYVSDTRIVIG
ncbi:MAG TPA: ubiquinol-cytochrome c reductase iron-sulfur subunit [Thermopetrobacter sp.]|nr:ubiquinol-cytochrome c reductase iron-sulfur subunit [Thermopetrobacter sp.]